MVDLPDISVRIDGVSIEYYAISGTSKNALISDMKSKGAACGLSDADACFYDTLSWKSQKTIDPSSGTCSVSSVDFTATYTIELPKWTGPAQVPASLATWWKAVLAHFVWHESQHLAIAQSYVPQFKQAILAGPCDQASQNKIAGALNDQLNAAQSAFDAKDKSWTWPA